MDGMMFSFKKPKVNEEITGEVVTVTQEKILLDINYICEGTIYRDQFSNGDCDLLKLVQVGDKVTAVVKKVEDGEHTCVLMSRLPFIREENFAAIKKAKNTHETLEVKVEKSVNKGLVAKYLGFEMFIPDGQITLDDEPVNKEAYVGKPLTVKITEIDMKNKILASHRSVLWDEYKNCRANELASINVGDIISGTVSEIKPYGALVKFEYNQGLLRIGNISHTRINSIDEVIKLGQKIDVKVINKEENKIDLSLKALLKTPYQLYDESHKASDVVTGKVVQKLPFGLVLELDKDVTGLLHKSEFSWNPNDNYDSYVKIGDPVTCAIIKIEVKAKKVSLSKKALEDNPWSRVEAKVGEIAEVVIEKIIPGKGCEVAAYGVKTFIPISDLTNKDKISKIEDFFAVGDTIKGKVVEVNKVEWVLKISPRRLEADIERQQFEEYQQDDAPSMTLADKFKDLLK